MHKIAVIPGDGIGREVVPEGIRAVNAASQRFGFTCDWHFFPWGCEFYAREGRMMPSDGLEILARFDAIFLGAVGFPGVPDHVSLWGLLLPIRKGFRQYVNLRPVRLLRGIESPLRHAIPGEIDLCIVRENNEGEYCSVGGSVYDGTDEETVIQASVFTRRGVERIIRFAFDLAAKRKGKHLTSATKSNALRYSMPFWDTVFEQVAQEYPGVATEQFHVDNLTTLLIKNPQRFDVIVASNLFGDILSDLGPALAGSLGIAPSANINPGKEFPSLFEPVHGSAPDIAGRGIANPVGQIWSAAMMLDHLGHADAAISVERAIEKAIGDLGVKTPDLGGSATTEEMGMTIAEAVLKG